MQLKQDSRIFIYNSRGVIDDRRESSGAGERKKRERNDGVGDDPLDLAVIRVDDGWLDDLRRPSRMATIG